jgi:NAD(P)-dependent dehydrogenase (short-subunit alcohol dehydrogenase family)
MSDRAASPLPPEAEGRAPGRDRLRGRRILVVGAGTALVEGHERGVGNGRAISILAGREGATVACGDRDRESAAATASAIEAEGGQASVIVSDVTDPDGCTEMVREAERELGGLDGVVLNVGILAPRGLAATDLESWDRVFATNARSHGLIAGAALPSIAAGGSLAFISSISAQIPGVGMPAYDATKAAVVAIARQAALEGAARGIRANAVLPGVVDTPFGAASAPPGGRDRGRVPLPLGRRGTAWDVAHAVVFLLSGEASYITGQAIVVDGGTSVLFAGA